ncbi:MAG: LysR family transcriptional regulator [Chloroflexota bacterium]
MLNYHHLRYFWLVAHEGNLTRTARKINIAQSALSMQISQLEEALGQQLFDRTGRQLVLTEAGRMTLDFADSIFHMGEELLGTLAQLEQPNRILRVGALATLSRNFQVQFLAPLLADQAVEVVIRSGTLGDLLQNLETYQLDVILTNVAPLRDGATRWVQHAIAEQPVSLIGPPRPGWQGKSLERLLAETPLVLPTPQSSIRTGFDALVSRLGIRPRILAEVDDMAMLRLVAREHEGLSVVPPIVVKDELDAGILTEVMALPGLVETFFAITVARRFPNPLLTTIMASPKGETL